MPYHAAGLCCLLPRLASIKLAVHGAFSYEKFADLLSSRHRAGTCDVEGDGLVQLREAALITWHAISASGRRARCLPWETFEKFTELRNSGLDFYVVDGGARLSLEDYFSPGEEEDDSQSEDEDERDFDDA
ncbi:hypothetical protein FIBSPDRAFT_868043 [Athelia psychrophila]|uniref:Uncharacterized protein n=1 Tax=Athelia psychrophila TaxID=1759441 RepID=A0A166DFI1_9AGAM|nr:hypothetical protein FIBSPDRAFT_868043 [Fibularhizoctonia sp. CBS 109695]